MTNDCPESRAFGIGVKADLETQYIRVDAAADTQELERVLAPAAAILASGGLVAFPTETVYGLGADALCPTAVRKIYAAKGRPSDNPMIVHVATVEDMQALAAEWPDVATKLAKRFMPGPLTLILKKTNLLSAVVSGGLDTIGLRIPENAVARALIRLAGVPVAAPSANRSGRPSPTEARHVMTDLGGRIDCVVDGGSTTLGLESTVLDLTTAKGPRILRPGAVTFEDLLEFLTETGMVMDQAARDWLGAVTTTTSEEAAELDTPKSPGMKYRHYAPQADVYLLEGNLQGAWKHLQRELGTVKIGLFASEELYRCLEPDETVAVHIFGSRDQADLAAHDLFSAFRNFDDMNCAVIVAERLSETKVGRAYMNRLFKAATYLVGEDQLIDLRKERDL